MDVNRELLIPFLLGPILAAIATAVVVWLREAIAHRDEAVRRREALATATQEVQFLQAWMAASRELDTEGTRSWVNERVRADLAKAYELIAQARVGDSWLDRKRPSVREISSAVLLWPRLTAPLARAGLVVYYFLLLVVLFLSSLVIGSFFPEFSSGALLGSAVILLTTLGLALLWRRLLLWTNRRHEATKTPALSGVSRSSTKTANAAVRVLENDVWRDGVLTEWRPDGESWMGRARFGDGTMSDWVPAKRLRYSTEHAAGVRSND
jgi:hypothetical protein